jgi:hypothetical protein
VAVGVEAAHGGPFPKNRATDSAPLGGNGPQYEGTVALDEYPFGKGLMFYQTHHGSVFARFNGDKIDS